MDTQIKLIFENVSFIKKKNCTDRFLQPATFVSNYAVATATRSTFEVLMNADDTVTGAIAHQVATENPQRFSILQ